jgi:hypothetical protein
MQNGLWLRYNKLLIGDGKNRKDYIWTRLLKLINK